MFTGIVEEVGVVRECAAGRLEVSCALVMEDMARGASIAVNGVCLTAVRVGGGGFAADLAPETLARTNLGDLRPGDRVNLERPLLLSTRLSGHIVQGHVEGTGVLEERDDLGIAVRVQPELDRLLVYKGSICLDGISLTIASLKDCVVRVAIVPHTWGATNLGTRQCGDRINIECDILARHVAKLMAGRNADENA